ncbi:MAG: histidine kinase [Verrucomicrobia bacterium]|nr:histidine kinase [Verrucomicrobiota bacterium]
MSRAASLQARIVWSDWSWHLLSNTNQVLPIPLSALAGYDDISEASHGWRIGNLTIATEFEDFTEPYAWQNPWFISLAFALVSTLIGGLGWWNAQSRVQLLQQERDGLVEQNALEQERKRIARDLHDELGATLSEISLLCSIAQSSKNPSQELGKIESRAFRSVEALEEIV